MSDKKELVVRMKPLSETLYTVFYGLFKSTGVALDVRQLETLRDDCNKLASILQTQLELAALSHQEELQANIVSAFDKVESRLTSLETRSSLVKSSSNLKSS
jgi:hypothetical protein